jgi:hypothetical protein
VTRFSAPTGAADLVITHLVVADAVVAAQRHGGESDQAVLVGKDRQVRGLTAHSRQRNARLERRSHDHALSAEPAAAVPQAVTRPTIYHALVYGIARPPVAAEITPAVIADLTTLEIRRVAGSSAG